MEQLERGPRRRRRRAARLCRVCYASRIEQLADGPDRSRITLTERLRDLRGAGRRVSLLHGSRSKLVCSRRAEARARIQLSVSGELCKRSVRAQPLLVWSEHPSC